MGRAAWFTFALVALCSLCVPATDTPADRATLRGLKALKVAVDPLGPELTGADLSAANLQTQIEDRLRKAGIQVDQAAAQFVGLRLRGVRENRGALAICFALDLYQAVALERDHTIKTVTETWGTQSVVLARPKQLNSAVSSTVDELATQFIDAYRSMNPDQLPSH